MTRLRPRRAGFTMVEMIIVLALAALVLAWSLPRASEIIVRGRVNRAATVVAAELEQAVTTASRGRTPLVVELDTTAKTLTIRNRQTNEVVRRRQFGAGSEFQLARLVAAPGSVQLLPSGVASATVQYTIAGITRTGEYPRTVTLFAGGNVRLTP